MPNKTYLLYSFVAPEHATNPSVFPYHISIPTQLYLPLYSDRGVIHLGERISETWYANWSKDNGYDTPVVKFEYQFDRDEKGLLDLVTTTQHCTFKNGEWSLQTKTLRKPYTAPEARMAEIKRRRENIVNEIKGRASMFGLSGAIPLLFKEYLSLINLYVESGDPAFRDAIATETKAEFAWFDEPMPSGVAGTMREFLVFTFSIGVNETDQT